MISVLSEILKTPEPLIYEAGGIIFAAALIACSHAMRRMLYVIGGGRIWLLPYAGAVLMLAVVILHFYGSYFLLRFHEAFGEGALLQAYRFRFVALLAMLLSSVLTVIGGLFFWLRVTGSRASRQSELQAQG